ISHVMSHVALRIPVNRNAARQPNVTTTIGTISGARIAPTFDPALKIPVASARSRRGNHSATVLIADGKLPASPNPNRNRAAPKPSTLLASAWLIAATLHTQIVSAYPIRVPSLSMIAPAHSRPIAYAPWNAVTMYP